ncbi:GTP-binding protein [Polymorphospora rubra]|uniref:CobW/HypB/UreG nucleotide-binding domain-containing protein n=1 Tax=Polymorphospora rubra TaxID=338584 RepID=A0A810N900_9ACTN|nr:GTP-binding protein [Polymorphospora rubra]BCJ68073.1 hypothetical protein Prubr_50940 [Polymorphospora rubra]
MITFIALSGFLGAGKTTTLVAAARHLQEQGKRVAVVTNDQGTELVDTKLVRSSLDSVAEVTGGCFCCRFEDLIEVVEELIAGGDVDVVIAEAVGSCTDLQATVVRPLRKFYGDQFVVAPLATVVDPMRLRAFTRAAERGEPESDLSYLFSQQLRESDVLAVNKIDLIGQEDQDGIIGDLRRAYPEATVIGYSAKTGTGLTDLLHAWEQPASWAADLDIDYDRYAAAEAQLAWLNQEFVIDGDGAGFSPHLWASSLLTHLAENMQAAGAEIGHAKLTVDSDGELTKMSITGSGTTPSVDLTAAGSPTTATATVNARVACEPAVLDRAVLDAVAHADSIAGTRSRAAEANSFKPGYPRPIHRLAAADV